MDKNLKPQFDEIIRAVGQSAFTELRRQAAQNGLTDMTLDEINQEIQEVRQGN